MLKNKLFFLFLGLLLFSSLSFAATWAVNGTGMSCVPGASANYTTIQEAINFPTVMAGDTIIVCRNSTVGYNENVVVNKSINIYGNESNVNVTAASSSLPVFNISVANVNITNFSVSGATTGSSDAGFYVDSTSNAKIYGVTAHSNYYGFRIDGSTGSTFANNSVYNNTWDGVLFTNSADNNTVNNITSYNNSKNGFSFSSNNVTATAITAYANIVYGISFGGDNNTVSHSTSHSNTLHGFYMASGAEYNLLSNGTAYNNTQIGIYLAAGSGNDTVLNSTAYNNSQNFQVKSTDQNVVGNTLYDAPIGFQMWSLSPLKYTLTNFSGNNVSNATEAAFRFDNDFNLTFTGDNTINSIPDSAYHFNISDGSFVNTSGYKVVTNNISYGFEGTEILIRTQNLSGDVVVTSMTDENGSTLSSDLGETEVLQSDQAQYFGLNVTNLTSSYSFTPTLYYSNKPLYPITTGIGKSNSTGVWLFFEATENTSTSSLAANSAFTSFSLFAPVYYQVLGSTGTGDDSGSSDELGQLEVGTQTVCENHSIVATVTDSSSDPVSGAEVFVRIQDGAYVSGSPFTTNSNGQAEFTNPVEGTTYEFQADKSPDYEESLKVYETYVCSGEAGVDYTVDTYVDCQLSQVWFNIIELDGSVGPSCGFSYESDNLENPDVCPGGECLEEVAACNAYQIYPFDQPISFDVDISPNEGFGEYVSKTINVDASVCQGEGEGASFETTHKLNCEEKSVTITPSVCANPTDHSDGLSMVDQCVGGACAIPCGASITYLFSDAGEEFVTFSADGYEDLTTTIDTSVCYGEGLPDFTVTPIINCDEGIKFEVFDGEEYLCWVDVEYPDDVVRIKDDLCIPGMKCKAQFCVGIYSYFADPGQHEFTFSSEGYNDQTITVDNSFCAGEVGDEFEQFNVFSDVDCNAKTLTFNVVDEENEPLCGANHHLTLGDLTLVSTDSECGSEYVYSFSEDQTYSASFSYGLMGQAASGSIACELVEDLPDEPIDPTDPNDPGDDPTVEIPPGGDLIIDKPDGKVDEIPNDGDTIVEYPIDFESEGDYDISVEVDGDVVASKTVTVLPAEEDNLLDYIQKNSVLCLSFLLLLIILGAFLWWRRRKKEDKKEGYKGRKK